MLELESIEYSRAHFRAFFTTKDHAQEFGLGLSVVYGIAKAHNGMVDAVSEPMADASFRLYFSVTDVKPITEPSP